MAKKAVNKKTELQLNEFDELIKKDWYFNEVYTYLLKFENEFTNLIEFIVNCNNATGSVLCRLVEMDKEKLTIKKIIEQRGYYERYNTPDYETTTKLNDFELYLTKFIVAHCLIKRYKEDTIRTTYFNQINSITERQQNDFKYFVDNGSVYYVGEKRVCNDWNLTLNTKFKDKEMKKTEFDFTKDLKTANEITDLQERLLFLKKRNKEFEQQPIGLMAFNDYGRQMKKEINYVQDLIESQPQQSTPTTSQPTPLQVKQIEPIKWQKDSVLLAYLINELKTYGFIDETNIWAICEQLFVDKKGLPIKATTFSSMVKNYENNQTTDKTKGKPKKHNEISTLIETIKIKSKENNS